MESNELQSNATASISTAREDVVHFENEHQRALIHRLDGELMAAVDDHDIADASRLSGTVKDEPTGLQAVQQGGRFRSRDGNGLVEQQLQ